VVPIKSEMMGTTLMSPSVTVYNGRHEPLTLHQRRKRVIAIRDEMPARLLPPRGMRDVSVEGGSGNGCCVAASTCTFSSSTSAAIIGTARLNGLDPEAFLAYVLERIADHPLLPSTAHVEPIR
jgi:hypothetical protein